MTRERSRQPLWVAVGALAAATAMIAAEAPTDVQAELPSRFTRSAVFSNLMDPTAVRFSPDGRVFVAERRGVVKVFDSLTDSTPDVFVDLRTEVNNLWDRGLLGLALAPEFPTDASVYVLYTHDAAIGETAPRWGTPDTDSDGCDAPTGATGGDCVVSGRLSRFVAVGNTAGPEQVLVEDWCQQFPSHSVGSLAFGADGALYASGGDGASFNSADYGQLGTPPNPCGDPPGGFGVAPSPPGSDGEGGSLRAQDLLTPDDPVGLDGTIIRINPFTGDGLPDNPLAASADANARRIVAMGLRNPFRIAVRPGTDELWVADVGQAAWEEINRVVVADGPTVENFGWPCYEGAEVRAAWVDLGNAMCAGLYADGPAAVVGAHFSYEHGEPLADETLTVMGSAISGLAFYAGGNYPDAYDGSLFFADYSRRAIYVMFAGVDGLPDPESILPFDTDAAGVVDLQVGPDGDLFWVDTLLGRVMRVRYRPENTAPAPAIEANPTHGHAPLEVQFSAAGTVDIDDDEISYAWDLDGDGEYDDSTAVAPSFTYLVDGDVTVGLRVTDTHSLVDSATTVVHVGNTAPVPTIDSPSAAFTWQVGQLVTFSGSANDSDDGSLPDSGLAWSLVMMHCDEIGECHEHEVQSWSGTFGGQFIAPDHEYPSYLELRLTATDSQGSAATVVRRLYPRSVVLRFDSEPPGARVTVGETTTATPFQRIVIAGSTTSISTAAVSLIKGEQFTFTAWSDRGSAAHSVAPTADTTYRLLLTPRFNLAATVVTAADRLRCDLTSAQYVRCATP
ncbi:MAG: PQQ-dependent sugar dehydrogenase [Actinomycetota bacterium]|nr:PQQ-dependent sugar dehydrogenase [Actinomycetota bacterium]